MKSKVGRSSSVDRRPRVVALLSENALRELKSVLTNDLGEIRCLNGNDSSDAPGNADAIFIEPAMVDASTRSYSPELLAPGSVPWIGFVELAAKNFQTVFRYGRIGLTTWFVYPMARSESERLRHFVITLQARRLAAHFVGALEASVGRLPHHLLNATLNCFEQPRRFDCASDLALQASVPRRCLYRNFDALHVGSPRKLLVAARIIHAYCYLRQQSLTVQEVADMVGYEKVETLVQHCQRILKCVPSALRAEPSEDEVLRNLFEWYCKPERRERLKGSESPYHGTSRRIALELAGDTPQIPSHTTTKTREWDTLAPTVS